jgi:hypothetical protein
MRIAAALLIGLLIGCLVIAGLGVFKNAVWAKSEQWARQEPPPQLTQARRALLHAGNFVDTYWIFASVFILPMSVGIAGFVAYRREHAQPPLALAGQSPLAGSSRLPFEVKVSTIFIGVAALSFLLGLLLLWLGRGLPRSSPLFLPGALLISFLFPLSSLVGTLLALIFTLWKRRWQFVLELALGIVFLALTSALKVLLPHLLGAV